MWFSLALGKKRRYSDKEQCSFHNRKHPSYAVDVGSCFMPSQETEAPYVPLQDMPQGPLGVHLEFLHKYIAFCFCTNLGKLTMGFYCLLPLSLSTLKEMIPPFWYSPMLLEVLLCPFQLSPAHSFTCLNGKRKRWSNKEHGRNKVILWKHTTLLYYDTLSYGARVQTHTENAIEQFFIFSYFHFHVSRTVGELGLGIFSLKIVIKITAFPVAVTHCAATAVLKTVPECLLQSCYPYKVSRKNTPFYRSITLQKAVYPSVHEGRMGGGGVMGQT